MNKSLTALFFSLFSIFFVYKFYGSNSLINEDDTLSVDYENKQVGTSQFEAIMKQYGDQFSNYKNIELNFGVNKISNLKALSYLQFCNQTEFLSLDFNNNRIFNTTGLEWLGNLYNLRKLEINLSLNSIDDVTQLQFLGNLQLLEEFTLNLAYCDLNNSNAFTILNTMMQLSPLRLKKMNINLQGTSATESYVREINRIGSMFYKNAKVTITLP
ncbi:hypothetical protein PPERSA_12035 [Pseudocohnilembus persalinus]|uniref:Uncharacterized protein n=1 Tax=Pseudocohnilembus persalinus TaxID=266149 RepID=A0A0V0R8U4_PSEPJ|nr:hypothetical protein PPERSA_12035 [Pseudocohnilembus persalinus]|eukprot:KRX10911.1 hypothetical protein PPERSA_12035 [Pseudocohnilembus persalinus]